MANIIQIKRSDVTPIPTTLAVGELAYSAQSGNLFIGGTGNSITKIGGNYDVQKLAGIEAGAQVNTVNSVNGLTGNVVLNADSVGALEAADIGVTVQAFNANTVIDGSYVHTDNNYTTAEKSKLAGIEAGAQVNTVNSVNGKTGTVVLVASDINANLVIDGSYVHTDNNFTSAYKTKLDGIEAGAQVNTVTSVAGKTGAVTLTSSDVGLGNVTNESKTTMFTEPTFTGNVTLGNSTPTQALHAASKAYVDSMSIGISVKDPVKAATTGAITLSGEQTIDSISVVTGDRVLVKNQADATTNGIYVVASGTWSRATDFDNSPSGEVRNGSFVYVEQGAVNAYTQFVLTVDGLVTIGTTELVFVQFGSVASYAAGTGLTLTGTTFAVDTSYVVSKTAGVIEALSGANLTNLNATNISSGTLADGRLSGNVLLNTSTIDGGSF